MANSNSPKTNGFDIELLNADKTSFGTQHISVSDNSDSISFTIQGQSTPIAVIDSTAKKFTYTAKGETKSVDISKVSMDHTETLTFTVSTAEGNVTFKIDGNSISQRKQGERTFTPVVVFDKPLNVELPKNLPEQIASGSLEVKAFPSQMLETLKTQYGYTSFESRDKRLNLLKTPTGELLVQKGNKIIPVQKSHYIDKGNNEAVLGLITTKSRGVVKRGSTSGIGFELSTEETLAAAAFIEGRPVEESELLKNGNEQILDFAVVPKASDATKKATNLGVTPEPPPPPIPPVPPVPPQPPEPPTPPQPPQPPQPPRPEPQPEPQPPEPPKPPKQEEPVKEDKKGEPKKSELITASLAFIIACVTFGLLVAGVGVAGWFVPALCVTSTAIAAGGAGVLTIHYTEAAKKSKEKKGKGKNGSEQTKARDKSKDKDKDKDKDNTRLTRPGRVLGEDYVPGPDPIKPTTPVYENQPQNFAQLPAGRSNERVARPTITPEATSIPRENIDELNLALQTAHNAQNTENYAQTVEAVIASARQINPQGDFVSEYSELDRPVIQATVDLESAYTAYTTSCQDYTTATENLTRAEEALAKKPGDAKAQQEYENCKKIKDYHEDLVNKSLAMLNGKIDILSQTVTDYIKSAPEVTHEKEDPAPTREAGEKITSLRDKFDEVYNGKATVEDYEEIVARSKSVIDELKQKESLTPEEESILELCENLVKLEDARQTANQTAIDLAKEIETQKNASEEERDEHKISELEQQFEAQKEEYEKALAGAKEVVAQLGNETKLYVDGHTYAKQAQEEHTASGEEKQQ